MTHSMILRQEAIFQEIKGSHHHETREPNKASLLPLPKPNDSIASFDEDPLGLTSDQSATHSVILRQEAIYQEIRTNNDRERKRQAKATSLLPSLQTSDSTFSTDDDPLALLSDQSPSHSMILRQEDQKKGARKRCFPKETPKSLFPPLNARESEASLEADPLGFNSDRSPHTHKLEGGRQLKILPRSRVEEAVMRGDRLLLIDCLGCRKRLLATPDMPAIFCPACGSLSPSTT